MLAEGVREHGGLVGGNLNGGERSSRQALYIGRFPFHLLYFPIYPPTGSFKRVLPHHSKSQKACLAKIAYTETKNRKRAREISDDETDLLKAEDLIKI